MEGKAGEGKEAEAGRAGHRRPPSSSSVEGKVIDESDDEEASQVQFKVILCGDGAVGKTSLATRFAQDHFDKSYKQTIGLDFFIKRLILPGGVKVALQIWDIGGQSIGSRMLQNYIYGADAVLLCYDITNYQSFQNLEDWYRLVKRTFIDATLPYVALVGNKSDLQHMRAVDMDKHNDFADENDFFSYVLSARSGDNVSRCFNRIAADLAGVVLTRPEFQVAHEVVKAEIIDHEKDDPNVVAPSIADSQGRCVVQ